MIEDIQEGQVRVSLEGFAGDSLVAVLERPDVEGKTFEEVIRTMNERVYEGKDKETLIAIRQELQSSGGYRATVGMGKPNRFEPIRLGDKVAPYIQPSPGFGQEPVLRTAVFGDQILG